MAEPRYGRQTHTSSIVLPYTNTLGVEAIELYRQTGKEPQPWQETLVYDMFD